MSKILFTDYLKTESGKAEIQAFTHGKLAAMYAAKGKTFDPNTPEAVKALKQISLGVTIAAEFLEAKKNARTNTN